MGLFDRVSRLLSSPADRRLADAEREAWQSAPRPLAISPSASPAQIPAIDWMRDQSPPPPTTFVIKQGYSDHEFQQYSAPLAFEGFSLDRIRSAVTLHRLGNFYESSALMVAVLGFAPVLAALQQAIAPILALPRHIRGGDRGLSRLVASEVEEMLSPETGLLPSPYLPPTLWGTMAIYLRMLGFCVLQHIDGDPDPETGVRRRYTRIWEPWALIWYRSPRRLIALTTEGPVEVKNDGKFTLVADEQEPYLSAAILALGEEAMAGQLTQEARLSFLDFFGKPKLWAKMPERMQVEGEHGNAFLAALDEIYGPDGRGVLPYGSELAAVAISGEGAKAFQDALLDAIIHIFMVLTGSAGTIGSGGPSGAGPYQPQKGGAWSVRHDLIARPTIAIVRALNQGAIAPYCDQNYGEAIRRAKRAGAWRYPTLEIPIPAPDREERLEGEIKRNKAYIDQLSAERAFGADPTQERADQLAKTLEVQPVRIGPRPIAKEDMDQKLFAPDELRAERGYAPLPNGAGSVERLAEERLSGGDEVGALVKAPQEEGNEE